MNIRWSVDRETYIYTMLGAENRKSDDVVIGTAVKDDSKRHGFIFTPADENPTPAGAYPTMKALREACVVIENAPVTADDGAEDGDENPDPDACLLDDDGEDEDEIASYEDAERDGLLATAAE